MTKNSPDFSSRMTMIKMPSSFGFRAVRTTNATHAALSFKHRFKVVERKSVFFEHRLSGSEGNYGSEFGIIPQSYSGGFVVLSCIASLALRVGRPLFGSLPLLAEPAASTFSFGVSPIPFFRASLYPLFVLLIVSLSFGRKPWIGRSCIVAFCHI